MAGAKSPLPGTALVQRLDHDEALHSSALEDPIMSQCIPLQHSLIIPLHDSAAAWSAVLLGPHQGASHEHLSESGAPDHPGCVAEGRSLARGKVHDADLLRQPCIMLVCGRDTNSNNWRPVLTLARPQAPGQHSISSC